MITRRVSELFTDLAQGAAAVAATRRLARHVEQQYAAWRAAQGASAWPAPAVRVLEDWLRLWWQTGFDHQPGVPLLLSDDQELLLWEQVIRQRGAAHVPQSLTQTGGIARAARLSWRRMHDWELDRRDLDTFPSVDTRAFVAWVDGLAQCLRERNWITAAELPAYLAARPAWAADYGQARWWLGFEALPPAQERLAARLEERGGRRISFPGAGVHRPEVAVVECADSRDQWTRIAGWARSELERDPAVSLGVVCPDLGARREEIHEILEDALHPELQWRVDAPRAFHLSLGRPLAEYPMVQTALDLLQCLRHWVRFEVISRTLRSPYLLDGDAEVSARSGLELALREAGRELVGLREVARQAEQRPGLADLSRAFADAAAIEVPQRLDPAGWAALFGDWLGRFGWPGERGLDSHEFQTLAAWREQLSRFAALGAVQQRWRLTEALRQLAAMAARRVLQFQDDRAPLQIVGAPEAAGLWFDQAWLADMSEAAWPPPAQPDPFIPVSLQKQCGMPGASAHAVLTHTRQRTDNLLACAPQLRVSFASPDSEVPAALSPLYAGYPAADGSGGGYAGRTRQLLGSGAPLQAMPGQRAPALPDGPLGGGVSLLADQARCPFQAFAHFRLGVRGLREVAPGLSAITRGKLLHQAVRGIWEVLGDQQTLNATAGERLETLIAQAVDAALAETPADTIFQERIVGIERRRLTALLQEWLSWEKQREPFRVAATELTMPVALGGGQFRVRVDRIDELADGRRMIIDYKTGQLARVDDWVDPRMEEPQLPVYVLAVDGDVAGMALAGIRRGECQLLGVGEGVPGLRPVAELGAGSMAELASWWRTALGELVAGHRAGDAAVDPKNQRTCQLCDAMSLCRIFEQE